MTAPRRRLGPRSIRGRATLAATSIFAVALFVAGVVSISLLRSTLIDNVDTGLVLRATDLRSLVRAGVAPRTIAIADDGSTVARIRLGDRTVAATANVRVLDAVDEQPDGGSSGAVRAAEGEISQVEVGGVDVRLLTTEVESPAGIATITVGTTLDEVESTVQFVSWSLLVSGVVLTGLAAATTRRLVGRSLRDVDELRGEVAEISVSDLDRRVNEPASDDEIRRLAMTMNDMLARLEAQTRAQQDFLAAASHELRTPIAVIQHRLSVAQRLDDVDWNTEAAEVSEELRRLHRLIDDLLYLARTSGSEAKRTPTSLVDLDDVVLDEVRQHRGRRTDVRFDTRRLGAGQVRGSIDQLRSVVRNLIDNALRHARTEIEVAVTSRSGAVELVVADDGPGVDPEDRDRVFERFVRLDADPVSGFGLGLAIVREVIERHGGEVTLDADARLGGARFVVVLPDARSDGTPLAGAVAAAER